MADAAETIEQSGRRIGHHAWVEMRLFEILGRWSGTVSEPRARALFASQSHHHAWHSELWQGLLPAVPHLPAADLVAPDPADAQVVAALEALDEPDNDEDPTAAAVTRIAAVHGTALPHLATTYSDHLEQTTPVTDGPTIRALHLVLRDLADDRAAGDALRVALDEHPPS